MTLEARPRPKHHPTKASGVLICALCQTRWPCLEAHRAVTRCVVCGALWSAHTDEQYRTGCKRPRSATA